MNVFADVHHQDLFLSLQLLFEKRFGWRLFRPGGVEWFSRGYWRLAELYGNHPDTIKQFLEIREIQRLPYIPPFSNHPLNKIVEEKPEYYVMESNPINHKVITPDQFFAMDINLVIASHPLHIESFKRLCNEHKNHPKLIYQIGNDWCIDPVQTLLVDGVMVSAITNTSICTKPVIVYHQEFDTDIFCYKPPVESNKITAILHCFDVYQDAQLFYLVETLMPEMNFKAFGATSRDGVITGHQNIADEIHKSRFIWHVKAGGDGYGHIMHNAFSCGRPPIVKKSYYEGKLAGQLMIDGATCITIDDLSPNQIVAKIKQYNEPEVYKQMSENAHRKFTEVVDFDKEAEELKKFLSNILNI